MEDRVFRPNYKDFFYEKFGNYAGKFTDKKYKIYWKNGKCTGKIKNKSGKMEN